MAGVDEARKDRRQAARIRAEDRRDVESRFERVQLASRQAEDRRYERDQLAARQAEDRRYEREQLAAKNAAAVEADRRKDEIRIMELRLQLLTQGK